MDRVRGSRVIVTGSAGGFGGALCTALRARGATVVGLDLRPAGDDDIACDITDAASVASAVAAAVERLGGLDVLVNNAGIGTAGTLTDAVNEHDRRVLEVNYFGTWNMTSAALPHLLATRGHVVNVASMLAYVALPRLAAYSASKRGVCALSDTLRAEHADDGLTVSTVYPGYVATGIHDEPGKRTGMSLHGRVAEESVEQVVRAMVRAIDRHPRDIATSALGTILMKLSRWTPRLVDRLVLRQWRGQDMGTPAA
ncbi:MAG: short-chain dehydrogenase/reductase sdr [Thermoleophilia bacterium]|nr:short-chain dehydrogenase/reductase sdr [Thermoleophilia bacterium]